MANKIVIYRESFVQSLLSDLTTFAFLILCIWFSADQGGGWWTFFTCSMFLLSLSAKKAFYINKMALTSKKEAQEWVESLPND